MSRRKNFRQSKAQFPVSGIFRAGGIFDNKKLLSHNYLFNVRATFSPLNSEISVRAENSTDWRSALIGIVTAENIELRIMGIRSTSRSSIFSHQLENQLMTVQLKFSFSLTCKT